MSVASDAGRIAIGINLAKARGTPCPMCVGSGKLDVGYAGHEQIGLGTWACKCAAGEELLKTWRKECSQADRAGLLERALIWDKFAAWDFETFGARSKKSLERMKALRVAREWVNATGGKPWLFLEGVTGEGKTGLGVACLKSLIAQGREGRFVSSMDMFSEMKARFNGDVEAYTDALAKIDVLMIDELVPVQVTPWRSGVLFELLWRRDAGQKLTIITTMAGRAVVKAAVSDAGWRRIEENAVIVTMKGNDVNYGV